MSDQVCMHYYVSGKVQGVWFRASAQEEAQRLNITGWARNLVDGRVEVLACGEAENMAAFYEWLKKGPARAKVTDVSVDMLPWQQHDKFNVI